MPERWRVRIACNTEITEKDLPPGIVSEVSTLYSEGTWAAVFTAERQHLLSLFDHALTLPHFGRFDVWRHPRG